MPNHADTTGRMTVYRLKTQEVLDAASVDGYDKVAAGIEEQSQFQYTLWFGDFGLRTPDWFPPFNSIVEEAPKVKQAGFVLLVNTATATYACTGGLGYHKLLECFPIKPRFGIAVAKKVLAVHNLKGLVQKNASGIVNNLDRAFRGAYNPQGDIDNLHRVLTQLRATFSKNSNEYAQIGSSIRAGDSLVVNKTRDFAGIFAFIKSVDDLWNSDADGLAIPELEHINPKHQKALIARLDQTLAIAIRSIAQPGPRPDLFLNNVGMGYLPDRVVEYTVCYHRTRSTHATYEEVFDELAHILADAEAEEGELHAELEAINLRLKFDDDYENAYKPMLQYICGDIVLDGEAYFISNGLWFKANADFIAKINAELDELLYLPPGDLLLQDWLGGEDEDAFNTKHTANGFVLLDKHLVRVPQERGPIEFCDLLLENNGSIKLIHVKHACGAELRALFAQGYVSAQLYSESQEFREKVHVSDIDMQDDLTAPQKTMLANLAGRPKRDLQVVYAIYDDSDGHQADTTNPAKVSKIFGSTITLFAKIDLLGRVQAIRSMGYSVALTRIPPYPA